MLAGLQAAFGGSVAALIGFSAEPGAARLVTTRPDTAQEYLRDWDANNPLHPTRRRARGLGSWTVATDVMLMPRRELTGTAYFNDFLLPNDMPHLLAVKLHVGGSHDITLNVMRGRGQGECDAAALALARRLHPHLQGAVRMAGQLAWTSLTADAAGATLDRLASGMMLLDQDGAVVHRSAAADRLLAVPDGLRLRGGRLVADLPSDGAALARLIGRAVSGETDDRRGGALRIARPSGRRAWAVIAAPMRAGATWLAPRRPAAIVGITDPEHTPLPPSGRLAELYGFTAREAEVALGIAAGGELKDVAERLGLTVLTARQYLSHALHKSDTGRQQDLVRLLVALGMAPI